MTRLRGTLRASGCPPDPSDRWRGSLGSAPSCRVDGKAGGSFSAVRRWMLAVYRIGSRPMPSLASPVPGSDRDEPDTASGGGSGLRGRPSRRARGRPSRGGWAPNGCRSVSQRARAPGRTRTSVVSSTSTGPSSRLPSPDGPAARQRGSPDAVQLRIVAVHRDDQARGMTFAEGATARCRRGGCCHTRRPLETQHSAGPAMDTGAPTSLPAASTSWLAGSRPLCGSQP